MKPARYYTLVLAQIVLLSSFSPTAVPADEKLPEDTNAIESLTPKQAEKLVQQFPGVTIEFRTVAAGPDGASTPLITTHQLQNCLPLLGLKSLDAKTAKALAGYGKGPLLLNGLTTLDAGTAKALAEFKGQELRLDGLAGFDADTAKVLASIDRWCGMLPHFTAFESPDSVAVAEALAKRKGRLSLPNLKKISRKTLAALMKKEDIEIPQMETLELIQEPK